jgi:hypothetical protein
MIRALGVLVLGLLVAAPVLADVPPPKGQKRVPLDHKIETEKEYPDYAFFTVTGGEKVTAVKLDPKNPLVIAGAGRGGRFRLCTLAAVPKDAEKKYGSEKEFHAAIAAGKVEGLIRAKGSFDSFTVVKDADKRTTVTDEYKLEKIDAKEGIVLAAKKDGGAKDPPEEESDESGDGTATAFAPRGPLWVVGMAASAAVLLAGLWLVTRCRSHRAAISD